MTPLERADKIWDNSWDWTEDSNCSTGCKIPEKKAFLKKVSAEIEEAVKEVTDSDEEVLRRLREVRTNAFEEAAKIAEAYFKKTNYRACKTIAEEIRRRAAEGEK